jgi:diguanylate cyclase (GGDEF)-like protein
VAEPITTLDRIDRVRRSAVAERREAVRCGDVASRHELLAATGPGALRGFHEKAAAANRETQTRHLVSAAIQASHVARLRAAVGALLVERRVDPGHGLAPLSGGYPRAERPGRDALTGLPNRWLFAERLAIAIEPDDEGSDPQGHWVAVFLISLDDVAAVIDRSGQELADRLLAGIARRLAGRLPGRLLARLGAADLAVLADDVAGRDEAIALADMALAAVAEPIDVDGQHMTVTASIGLQVAQAGRVGPAEMMRAAEISLGWAKSEGHGQRELFDTNRNEQALSRSALTAALPAAIDSGEIFLEFQPIISLDDGALVGTEALVRWQHPTLGRLAPDQFIDIAEESALIVRLGQEILRLACREAAGWPAIRPNPPYVSVNVAARQLYDSDFAYEVARVLDQTGLPAQRLCLEITEGAVVRPDDRSMSALDDLVALGVTIVIDDFGTGYSNLSYLRRLPVGALKIDRSFVTDLFPPDHVPDGTDAEILAAIVSMAHALHLTVIAEGVETGAQAELLQSIGCDSAQGWHFGRPAGPADIEASIASGAAPVEPARLA